MLPRGLWLLLTPVIALLPAACGDDATKPTTSPTPTETRASRATTLSPTTTVIATPRASAALDEVLALSGFSEFAADFEAAVELNDTQFFIDNVHFEDYTGCADATVPTLTFGSCMGIETPPNGLAVSIGLWNSEGGYSTPSGYAELIQTYLSVASGPNSQMYAIGKAKRGRGELDSGVDLVVEHTGRFVPPGQQPPAEAALIVRIHEIGAEWRIVSLAQGATPLVPDFFEWWVPWYEVFP